MVDNDGCYGSTGGCGRRRVIACGDQCDRWIEYRVVQIPGRDARVLVIFECHERCANECNVRRMSMRTRGKKKKTVVGRERVCDSRSVRPDYIYPRSGHLGGGGGREMERESDRAAFRRGRITDGKAAGRNKKPKPTKHEWCHRGGRRRADLTVRWHSRHEGWSWYRLDRSGPLYRATYGHADEFGQTKNGRRLIQVLSSRTRLSRTTGPHPVTTPPIRCSSFDTRRRISNRLIHLSGS